MQATAHLKNTMTVWGYILFGGELDEIIVTTLISVFKATASKRLA